MKSTFVLVCCLLALSTAPLLAADSASAGPAADVRPAASAAAPLFAAAAACPTPETASDVLVPEAKPLGGCGFTTCTQARLACRSSCAPTGPCFEFSCDPADVCGYLCFCLGC